MTQDNSNPMQLQVMNSHVKNKLNTFEKVFKYHGKKEKMPNTGTFSFSHSFLKNFCRRVTKKLSCLVKGLQLHVLTYANKVSKVVVCS